MPLELKEHQRRLMANRLMLQLPKDTPPRQLLRARQEHDRVVRGLPGDVFMALDALRVLADQGNIVAADLFTSESARLGLTVKTYSFRK